MIMGKIRTNWNRNLVRYGERTGRIGMMYGSTEDSLDCSAGVNLRKVADWVGVDCSIRFLHLQPNATAVHHLSSPIALMPTYLQSTDTYAGFNLIYISQGTVVTVAVAKMEVFDWQAIVVSL